MALRNIKMPPKKPVAKPTVQAPAKPKIAVKKPIAAAPASGGNDGFSKARQINAQNQREAEIRRNRPIPFRMGVGEGGEKGVVITILDRPRLPGLPHFHYMHHWGFEEGDPKSEVCIQDDPDGCPLCKHLGRKGTHEMVLSCIDKRPYTPKKGPNAGKTDTSPKRKIVEVKTSVIPQWERLYKEHKTFRGMVVRIFRDNAKSPSAGSQIQFIKFLPELELKKYKDLSEPVDMEKAYPRPSAQQLRQQYNIGGDDTIGGEDTGAGIDDSIPF